VTSLTEKIDVYNERIEQIARNEYPETELLKQIKGVGTLIALTFVLTVGDAGRFESSRDVGGYGPGKAIQEIVKSNWASRKKAIVIFEQCWCKERITYSARVGQIPI